MRNELHSIIVDTPNALGGIFETAPKVDTSITHRTKELVNRVNAMYLQNDFGFVAHFVEGYDSHAVLDEHFVKSFQFPPDSISVSMPIFGGDAILERRMQVHPSDYDDSSVITGWTYYLRDPTTEV